MPLSRRIITAVLLTYGACCSADSEAPAVPRPAFDAKGTVHVPAFDLPPSQLSSAEAQSFMKMRAGMPAVPTMEPDIEKSRRALDTMLASQVQQMLNAYPVKVEEQTLAGVPIRVVTPEGKKVDASHVLIDLHGGGFNTCWNSCSLLESAPVAVVGGYKVISINYRMAPEAKHPAAVQDIAAVYAEVLKTYSAKDVGIYGCSAGGALTAQAAAWLPAHGLAEPGAIGIFGAGAVPFGTGDSAYVAGYIDGSFPPPPPPGGQPIDLTRGYFAGADMTDPIISPALHPDVLRQFPPTLLITGTRAMDMSPAIYTNSQLLKAGRDSTLVVGEGMGHCYMYQLQIPEARDVYAEIAAFFHEKLH